MPTQSIDNTKNQMSDQVQKVKFPKKKVSKAINQSKAQTVKMAFSFPAFSYIIALIVDAFLIFFSIFHVIAFDELKTDYKNPIDQCNSLNPVSIYTKFIRPYLLHIEIT